MFGAAAAQHIAAQNQQQYASTSYAQQDSAGGSSGGSGAAGGAAAGGIGAADWDDFSMSTSAGGATVGRALDLVFIMDATGSMGSYIREATKNIETICDDVSAREPDGAYM